MKKEIKKILEKEVERSPEFKEVMLQLGWNTLKERIIFFCLGVIVTLFIKALF